jgi:hypothetical protein
MRKRWYRAFSARSRTSWWITASLEHQHKRALKGDPSGAEQAYKAALAVAREQEG